MFVNGGIIMSSHLQDRARAILSTDIQALIAELETDGDAGIRALLGALDDVLADIEDEIGHLAAHAAQIERHLDWLRMRHDALGEKLQLALEMARAELAEAAIAAQMRLEDEISEEEQARREVQMAEQDLRQLAQALLSLRRRLEGPWCDWLKGREMADMARAFLRLAGIGEDEAHGELPAERREAIARRLAAAQRRLKAA